MICSYGNQAIDISQVVHFINHSIKRPVSVAVRANRNMVLFVEVSRYTTMRAKPMQIACNVELSDERYRLGWTIHRRVEKLNDVFVQAAYVTIAGFVAFQVANGVVWRFSRPDGLQAVALRGNVAGNDR